MSLFESGSSCGPNTALQDLTKHSQRDRSVFQTPHVPPSQSGSFRPSTLDHSLEKDFQSFSNPQRFQSIAQPTWNGFQGPQSSQVNPQTFAGHSQTFAGHTQSHHQSHPQSHHQIHLNPNQTHSNSQSQGHAPSWNQEYKSFHQTKPAHHVPLQNVMSNFSYMSLNERSYTEHQEMHQMEVVELDQLDSEFEQVEKELDVVQDHPDKEKFAAIAKSIFSSMTQTSPAVSESTSRKFQQSSFLQLMDSVAKRKVELNDTSDKLIDEKGKDIREYLPDPLKDLKEGDLLESSYQAASLSQRRSGFDMSPSDWEDDYRHEDDMI